MECPKCNNHNIVKKERNLKTFLGTMVTIEYECLKCNVKFNLDKMAENKNFLNNEKKNCNFRNLSTMQKSKYKAFKILRMVRESNLLKI
jgi:DNA-directed RNA polymerase subunit RPC12/RpoP